MGDALVWINVVISIFATVVLACIFPAGWWLVSSIFTLRETDRLQEFKIQELWRIHTMNAQLKVARDYPDLGGFHSPFAITQKARDLYQRYGFVDELHKYYLEEGRNKTPVEVQMDISARFRDRFATTVCRDQGFTDGECIVIAAEIAREADGGHRQIDSDAPRETRLERA